MSPADALQRQLEAYRRMTPQQRLEIALGLHELACDMARAGIRDQNPNATEEQVQAMLRRRLELARQ